MSEGLARGAVSESRAPAAVDAARIAALLARDPAGLGGVRLRGAPGPGTEAFLAALAAAFAGRPVRRLPIHIDSDRLSGGIDVAASLAAGRKVDCVGLLAEVAGGLLIAASAERIAPAVAARIGAGMEAHGFALVVLDESCPDEAPPSALTERLAFDVTPGSALAGAPAAPDRSAAPARLAPTEPDLLRALESTARLLGVAGTRPLLLALRTAAAAAGLAGRRAVAPQDAAEAAQLVLAPRATQIPAEQPPEPPPPPEQSDPEQPVREPTRALEDIVLQAARAALPEGLEGLAEGRSRQEAGPRGGAGEKRRSPVRGRVIGSRAGQPGGQCRLALVETLRAAAPWQRLRQRAQEERRVRLRREDLRVRRFEARAETLTIFAVDASGSAAFARLAEAKGAVELLLERAHSERAEVALLAFRGTSVDLLLPPTRSLTRARRLLAELPGGGGTPLAMGLDAARLLAEASRRRGRTPRILLLTDGKANIAADGSPGRPRATEDAAAAAGRIAAASLAATLIDISPRPQPEASKVAGQMNARYLHLPRVPGAAMHAIAAA